MEDFVIKCNLYYEEYEIVKEALVDKLDEVSEYRDDARNRGNQEMVDYWTWYIDSIDNIICNLRGGNLH